MNPSEVSAGRTEALHAGQKLVRYFDSILHEAGYHGALALAGGYLRDVALCRTPKDLDLFVDGGKVQGMAGAENLAAAIANRLIGASVGRSISCYGSWAEDITCVVSVNLSSQFQGERIALDGWPKGCMIPEAIDIVVLIPERLKTEGFTPRLTNDAYNQELFLKATLARVDLRLNALGATPAFTYASPDWDMDAYNSRLVIQKTRGDGTERIAKRLTRLMSDKFRGWTAYREQEDGSLSSLALPADGSEALSPGTEGLLSGDPPTEPLH